MFLAAAVGPAAARGGSALVAIALVAGLLAAGSVDGSSLHLPLPAGPLAGPGPSEREASTAGLAPTVPELGTVLRTVVLPNDTVFAGNYLPLVTTDADALAFDPPTDTVVVAGFASNTTTFVDSASATPVRTVSVGAEPDALAVDPTSGEVYVASNGTRTVDLLSDTAVAEGTAAVGTGPFSLAYDPEASALYVGNAGSDNLTVVDAATGAHVGDVALSGAPTSLACDPATGDVFVVESSSSDVSVVAPNRTVVALVHVGVGELAAAYDPANGDVYFGGNQTIVVNATDFARVTTVRYSASPSGFAVDPSTGNLYMPWGSDLLEISAATNAVVRTIPNVFTVDFEGGIVDDPLQDSLYTIEGPPAGLGVLNLSTYRLEPAVPLAAGWGALAVDPSTGDLWGSTSNGVARLNGSTDLLAGGVAAAAGATALEYDAANGYVYAASPYPGNVSAIDPRDLTAHRVPGSVPYAFALAFNPDDNRLYVATGGSSAVWEVASGTNALLPTTLSGPPTPQSLIVDAATDELYIPNGFTDQVWVVNASTGERTAEVPVPDNPQAGVVDPRTGDVYIVDQGAGTVSVLNGRTYALLGTIPVGADTGGIAFDAGDGLVYVAITGSDEVTAIDPSVEEVVGSITVGPHPATIAYDPVSGDLVVANQ
ncbi:MAG TPA: YncE family protein, partial [Thermoplasmata archaeon]|nr:YncE family protein [Thermoplasmata archaeon]